MKVLCRCYILDETCVSLVDVSPKENFAESDVSKFCDLQKGMKHIKQ